jgi:hypothetical protein
LASIQLTAKGGDDAEATESEVGHGAGGCADVEGVTRGDEDYIEMIALGRSEQGLIVELEMARLSWLWLGSLWRIGFEKLAGDCEKSPGRNRLRKNPSVGLKLQENASLRG